MADRSVVVRLRAEVAGFQAAMAASGASADQVARDLERMQTNGGTALGRLATSADLHRQSWQASGMAVLGFGAAVVTGVALAVKAYADFDAKMAQVQSLSHASTSEMNDLTQAALNMGQNIGFSATQVADAEIELVKAGISVKDIMGGALVGSLTLAAAGQISVADATEIATIAMTQFKLSGSDIPHVADLLAAGADKALGGVSELGEALKSGGLVAHQFGLSLDDTVGTLALFAQNGLMGEAAGTDLRQMLLKLAAPSKTSAKDMADLGLVLYNSQGHFVGITALAGQLHDKMQGLSEAERNAMMAHIFGARSIVGANILYAAGAKGVQGWISAVNDSGFAAKQAAGKMDTMNGDLNKLKAAWQTAMIEMGASTDSFVRPIIQGVTSVIHWFEEMPQPLKVLTVGFAAAGGGALVLAGGFLMLAPRVFDTIRGFKQLAQDSPRVASALGKIGKRAGIAAVGLIAIGAAMAIFTDRQVTTVEDYANAILKVGNAGKEAKASDLTSVFSKWDKFLGGSTVADVNNVSDAVKRLANRDVWDNIGQAFDGFASVLHVSKSAMGQIQDRFKGLGEAMGGLVTSGQAPAAAKTFSLLTAEFKKNGQGAKEALDALPGYKDALLGVAHAAGVSLTPQELLAYAAGKIPAVLTAATSSYGSYTDAVGQSQPVTEQMSKDLEAVGLAADGTVLSMDKLISSMAQAGLIQLSADSSAIAYHRALDDLTASVQTNGHTLDLNTAAGRANRTALDNIAQSGLQLVQANAKNGDSQASLTKTLHTTYDALVAGAGQFGITGGAADTLARKVLGIPKGVKIDSAIQNYIDSMLKLEGINNEANNVNGKTVDIWVNTHQNTIYSENHVSNGQGGSGGQTRSTGGLIHAMSGGGQVNHLSGGGMPHWVDMRPVGTDTVPAMLTPGEMVINAAQTRKNLPYLEAINAGADLTPAGYGARTEYGGRGGGSQMVTVNLVLDGKIIDRRIVNLSKATAGKVLESAVHDAMNRR